MRKLILLLSVLGLTEISSAQGRLPEKSAAKSGSENSSEPMRIKSESDIPARGGNAPILNFNEGDEEREKRVEETVNDETVFDAFPGYPKSRIGLGITAATLNSSWSFGAYNFNFSSLAIAYEVSYEFVARPNFSMQLKYQTYEASTPDGTVKPYRIIDSTAEVNSYGILTSYCFLSQTSFYRRFCPNFSIENDAYPILNFVTGSGTNLQMGTVKDLVVGLGFNYMFPVTEKTNFSVGTGLKLGTGTGQTGALTSKSNSSYLLSGTLMWEAFRHGEVDIGFEGAYRSANIHGKAGSAEQDWKTISSWLAGRMAFVLVY